MANTYLSKTQTSGNADIFTSSTWVKRTSLGELMVWCVYTGSSNYTKFGIDANDRLKYDDYQGTQHSDFVSNQRLRDVNGWYHLVCAVDTTNSTAGDRVKIYVNGVRVTSWFTQTNYPLNQNTLVNSGNLFDINVQQAGNVTVGGLMSHYHFIDGTAYDASYFGSTDSTTGEWKINTSPSVTYGTNGFFILKDGNTITDSSPNSNNFSLGGGTLTKTEDNPSNVFATFNPLIHFRQPTPLLYGNTAIENGDAQWENGYGTIATPTTGKFYAEFKYPVFGGTSYGHTGIIAVDDVATQASGYQNFGDTANSWSISVTDGRIYHNGSSSLTYSSISANGIIGLAIDCTNSKLYISVNGTWQNSADPSAGTGGISITSNKEYYVGGKVYNCYINANYGNGYFGTTAVSSAGTNASGIGIFEYDVPTGFTALSTKGLNQ